MKSICIFGAGKSATCLIEYLVKETAKQHWNLVVADANASLAASKLGNALHTRAVGIDINNEAERKSLIQGADLVISMLPPQLHILVARDCIEFGRHLLTASYIDESIRELQPEIDRKNILFLCETGLDPGIDHMSAMQLIQRLKRQGARIVSFKSHCGGLVAPESDNNPWHYKISWNPRNVVMAGKAGAIFKEEGQTRKLPYESLFDANRVIAIPDLGYLAWYPNRDSLAYQSLYKLEEAETFIRTTLRYPEFCFGWKNIIELKLTDETPQYDTDGMSLQVFFQEHFSRYGFSDWVEKQLTSRFAQTKQLLEKLQQLLEAEEGVEAKDRDELQDFMMIDDNGQLMDINLDKVKTQAAATVAGQMHEANLSMKQLLFLGMDDSLTLINKGRCSAMDILQFAMERKMALLPGDKDMIVMLHEIDYIINSRKLGIQTALVVKGEDGQRTAMAKTVGLPLGIAAKLVLTGEIKTRGLHIPILPEIYEPILAGLETHSIRFQESTKLL